MFQLGLKMSLNLRKQRGSTVRKAVVEFHAQNICPGMCQVFRNNGHCGIIDVVCEGSGIRHCTERGRMVPSSQVT